VHTAADLINDLFFVARQRRITVEDDHFYVDLVFYHRHLRCFLLVDLKIGKITHGDVGQMLMYLGYFEANEIREGENPPIGLILGADKNDTAVRYTTSQSTAQLFASRYKLELPNEQDLISEISKERQRIEATGNETLDEVNDQDKTR